MSQTHLIKKGDCNKSQCGFITLFAMVITITVVGGGILLGAAGMTNVNKQGCGDSLNSWKTGDVLARLGDADDSQALDEALKCQEAITESVKAAKVVAIGMDQTGIIASGGGKSKPVEFIAELVGETALNYFGDYVEKASDPKKDPPKKDKSLPSDIKKIVKEKREKEKEKQNAEDQKEPSGLTKILNNIEKKIQGIDVDNDGADKYISDTGKEWERPDRKEVIDNTPKGDSCAIGFSGTAAPKLKLECPSNPKPGSQISMTTHFSDPQGDIKKISVRMVIKIPAFQGVQPTPWAESDINESRKCGTIKSPPSVVPSEFDQVEDAIYELQYMLIDAAGNKSNTESCVIIDTR